MIEKEIPNAFPELNPIFDEVHNLTDRLKDVLVAFTQLRPDIGF
jgi:hypothetical protein